MPPNESPVRSEVPSTEDDLRAYLEQLFVPSEEAKYTSDVHMILEKLSDLNEQGLTELVSSQGQRLPVEKLITAIQRTQDLVESIKDTVLPKADDEMRNGINTIAANSGITRTAGLRDAVVHALYNDVKRHRQENDVRP
jgi:hypothetical protein